MTELAHTALDTAVLPLITARELCDQPDPEGAPELVGPLVMHASRTIVGGQTGQGKTTFAYALIAAYVNETDFLGWSGAGGRALVVDLEQGERTIKKRLREAKLHDSDDVDMSLIPQGIALNSEASHRHALEQTIQEGGYGIVLLDPHYKAHDGDANDEGQVKVLMSELDRLRAQYGFALILPTHGRKPPPGGSGRPTIHDIAAGSGAITRGAEIVLAVEIGRPGLTHLYVFKHRDGDDELPLNADPWTLTFSRDDGYQRINTERGPKKAAAEEIAEWVRGNGGRARPTEIKKQFEIADGTLRDRRERLAELGISYTGKGQTAEYVASAQLILHPAVRTPQPTADSPTADSEPPEQAVSSPQSAESATRDAAGVGNEPEQGFPESPQSALPKGSSRPAAGQATTPASDEDNDPEETARLMSLYVTEPAPKEEEDDDDLPI